MATFPLRSSASFGTSKEALGKEKVIKCKIFVEALEQEAGPSSFFLGLPGLFLVCMFFCGSRPSMVFEKRYLFFSPLGLFRFQAEVRGFF